MVYSEEDNNDLFPLHESDILIHIPVGGLHFSGGNQIDCKVVNVQKSTISRQIDNSRK